MDDSVGPLLLLLLLPDGVSLSAVRPIKRRLGGRVAIKQSLDFL